ncbi:MAG: hypothetical protein M1140_07220, partial [Chloroflexi bacterium]|nr:hypothetical protein [Chloroflexota bacterium]
MQRTSNDTMNSARLRATLRTWLDNAGKRPVWLAQEAGLNPSILSRFLNHKTQLDQVSALKLYKVLKQRMTVTEQQDYLEAAGLLDLIHDLVEPPPVDVLPPRQLGGPHDPLLTGMAYLNAANQAIQRQSVKDATPLLSAAEKAFGPTSTNAAYAACRIGINLSILGDVDGAVNELTRAGTTYADIMDISTRVYYYTARGYVEFDRANPDTAYRWCRQAIETAQRAGIPELAEDSATYMALIPIEIGRIGPDTRGLGG